MLQRVTEEILMPIYASAKSSGQSFAPAPAGTHVAVACDVVDLGVLEVTYGGKTKSQHKVRLVWQLDELREDGSPYLVFKRYTKSLHEKAALRKDLESWRGKPFTATELEQFDLENLLGIGCMLSVIHTEKGESTYANVTAIMKLAKGMTAPKIQGYIRVCDRDDGKQAIGETQDGPPTWDDMPDMETPPF